jgi:hypothetical protein
MLTILSEDVKRQILPALILSLNETLSRNDEWAEYPDDHGNQCFMTQSPKVVGEVRRLDLAGYYRWQIG